MGSIDLQAQLLQTCCSASNTMVEHNFVLAPWQIYCGMFVMFWASQCYFSSFWMTILCCLKFGLLAELITDYMYRRGRYKTLAIMENKNKLNCLMDMVREEAALVPNLTEMAMVEANNKTPVEKVIHPSGTKRERFEEEMMGNVKNKLNHLYQEKEEAFNEKALYHDRNYGEETGTF